MKALIGELKIVEPIKKPPGVFIGEVVFSCESSRATIKINLYVDGDKMHIVSSHEGVKYHTPMIEMYTKLMKAIRL